MQNEIIVNAERGETRVALLERSQFIEFHIERAATKDVVGNVVKARVSRVLPGMQAAFVDIGLEKAGFLYVGDYFNEPPENRSGGRGRGRGRDRQPPPPIDTVLSEGQEIVVQIAKEPIGTKGARITSHVSIAGRHLVLTPWSPRVGVSRRIDSDRERRRLREVVERLRPRELGFIIRTAGDGLTESDLEADIKYLTTVWSEIQEKTEGAAAPSVLYTEPDLPQRVLRDFANSDTKRIAIDDKQVYENLLEFSKRFVSDPQPVIEHYQGKAPIFDHFDLEAQIHANLERKVPLKSGGSIVIDQSEALTAIDVNSGRYVGKRDLEETVYRTNLEAVKEVVHQLRFRNIGGLIIIDLIDMESRENREKVYRALQDAARQDKAKTNVLKISELGLVEMTRKRTRENLVQALCEPCGSCEGRGYVLSSESVGFKVMRQIRKDMPAFCGRKIAVTVSSQVAHQLLGPESEPLALLSEEFGREIEVRARPGLHQEQFEISTLDQGPPVEIALDWLDERKPDRDDAEEEMTPQEPPAAAAAGPDRGEDSPGLEPAGVEDPAGGEGAEPPGEEAAPAEPSTSLAAPEQPTEPPAEPAQPLDESVDSRILPGSPTKPASEDS
ncbi:MAG: Rne/Rng family ribonuclease [Myxococcota bacterium]|nr:Rne/Rng family ribonuclease [Myxococcota bacterium]